MNLVFLRNTAIFDLSPFDWGGKCVMNMNRVE